MSHFGNKECWRCKTLLLECEHGVCYACSKETQKTDGVATIKQVRCGICNAVCGASGCDACRTEGQTEAAAFVEAVAKPDEVDHPAHYTQHASGVECITIAEEMSFNLGNAIKYIWRADLKTDDPIKDLKKAAWYVNREIGRLKKRKS